jgi:hypothetical protein
MPGRQDLRFDEWNLWSRMMSRSTWSRSGPDRVVAESSSMPRTWLAVVATRTVGRTQLLAFDAGHQDFLLVRGRPGGARRFGRVPAGPADGKDSAEPRQPPVLRTGGVPSLLGLPDLRPVLREGGLIPGRIPVVTVGPQPDLPEQGSGMIR